MRIFAVLRAVAGVVGLAVATSSLVMAQSGKPLDVPTERLRISQQRQHHEAVFSQAEVACYRRFAVSDCLREARKLRRSALDELRRQEIVLNDEERRFKGSQALQRIQNNISSQNPAGTTP